MERCTKVLRLEKRNGDGESDGNDGKTETLNLRQNETLSC